MRTFTYLIEVLTSVFDDFGLSFLCVFVGKLKSSRLGCGHPEMSVIRIDFHRWVNVSCHSVTLTVALHMVDGLVYLFARRPLLSLDGVF